ncbi:MAG: hypothetical protein U5L72_05260 [Bacteroidales bacterium]|nr:hypothetical protein [Bacteroidales bacterium]
MVEIRASETVSGNEVMVTSNHGLFDCRLVGGAVPVHSLTSGLES